jgi:hypothetical protein
MRCLDCPELRGPQPKRALCCVAGYARSVREQEEALRPPAHLKTRQQRRHWERRVRKGRTP